MRILTSNSSEAIVAEAQSWLGTPYHDLADVKGRGVDCAMLVLRVYQNVGLVPERDEQGKLLDPRPYSPQFFLHRSEEVYLGWVEKYADRVSDGEQLAGDAALFKFGRCVSHGGILDTPTTMIHADGAAKKVERGEIQRNPYYWAHFFGFYRVRE